MEAGDWIGVAALVIAFVSLVVNGTFTTLERRQRKAEAALLRQQVEGEARERDDRRRARIVAEQGQISGGEREDIFDFTITNLGPSAIRDVDVKVRTPMGDDLTPRVRVATGMLAAESRQVRVPIPRPQSRSPNVVLWARWRDELDDHEEPLALPIRPL